MKKMKKLFQMQLSQKELRTGKRIMASIMLPMLIFQMTSMNFLAMELMTARADDVAITQETQKVEVPKVEAKEEKAAPKEEIPKVEEKVKEEAPKVEEKNTTEVKPEVKNEAPKVEVAPAPEAAPVAPTKDEAVVSVEKEQGTITPEAASIEKPVEATAVSIAKDAEWIFEGNVATIEPVVLNKTYKAPQNDQVTVTFTKLPEKAGSLVIKEIKLSPKEQATFGALTDTAYDITSDMENGTFKYDLTLPYPEKKNNEKIKAGDVQVLYTENDEIKKEDLKNITEDQNVDRNANDFKKVMELKGLEHFTIFVVVNPTPTGSSCVSAGATDNNGCYLTVQAAINAATNGDTINVKNGTYVLSSTLNVNKEVSIIGESESGVIINASSVSGYGITNSAGINKITLKNFSLLGPSIDAGSSYGIKATHTNNLTIENVTVGGSGRSEVDLNTVNVATLKNVTANGKNTKGVGIALSASSNITLDGVVTTNNAWGGVGLYDTSSGTTSNVAFSGSGSFGESWPIYIDAEYGHAVTNITLPFGYNFGIRNTTFRDSEGSNRSEAFTVFRNSKENAVSSALAMQTTPFPANSDSYIQTVGAGGALNNSFVVGEGMSMQAAINAAVSGSTINVDAGTYIEGQIIVDKNITLTGENKATTIIHPSSNTTMPGGGTSAPGDGSGWFVISSGVNPNISGFTFDGSGKNIGIGILSHGGGTISDNIITNIHYAEYRGFGVYLWNGTTNVTNNTFSNIERVGTILKGSSKATILRNTYTGKGAEDRLDYGIELGAGAHATITDNTISNNIGVAYDGSTSAGIMATTYYGSGTEAKITGNTISNCTDGIAVGYDGSDSSDVTAHDNQFIDCGTGINSTHPTVNATGNWWGDQSGPGVIGSGIGDKVSANVTYSPWCLDADCFKTSAIYSEGSEGAVLSGIPQDITVGNLKIKGITGTGDIFVAKYHGLSDVPNGGTAFGVGSFYYNIDAPAKTVFPVNIEIAYSDNPADSNYLDENHFSTLYYQSGGIWHDYRLDDPASTVSIDKNANKITASLQHLTPIVPVLDTTPPSVPTGGTPNNAYEATNNFDFNWNDSTDENAITYEFQSSLNPAQIGGVLTTGLWNSGVLPTSMIHSSGAPDGTWYWQVRAIDSLGNTSAWSEIWNMTIDTNAPAKPTGLKFQSQDRTKDFACGEHVPLQVAIPNWDDVTGDSTFDHYEYTSFLPNGSVGLNEQVLTVSELNNSWMPPAEGAYGYAVRSVDKAGNKSDWALSEKTLAGSCQIIYDSTAPTVNLIFSGTGPSIKTFQAAFSENVNQGEAENPANYFLQNWPGAGGSGNLDGHATVSYNSTSHTATVTLTTSGWYISPEQEWGVRNVHDLAGNLQAVNPYSETSTAMLDPTNPGTPTPNVSSPTNSTIINWVWAAATDAGSGVKQYLWELWNSTVLVLSGATSVAGVSTSGLTDETYTMKVTAEDNAGNQSGQVSSASVTVDTVAPVITINPYTTTLTNQNITVTASTNEGALNVTSHTFTSNAAFDFIATDAAGNSTTKTVTITNIDKTTPAVPQNNLPGNDSYLNTHNFTFFWNSVSDLSSPVVYEWEFSYSSSTNGSGGSFVSRSGFHGNLTSPQIASPGTPDNVYFWHVRAIDAAGNASVWSDPWKVTVDNIAPVLASQTIFSGWYNAVPQTSMFNYTDINMAGGYVAPTCNIATEGVGQTCSVTPNVCDKAGNCNTATVVSNGADIDLTIPTSTITSPSDGPEGVVYLNNWNRMLAGTAGDNLSGVQKVELLIERNVAGGITYWNGLDWQPGEVLVGATGTTSWTYGPLASPLVDGEYSIESHATDNAGNKENTFKLKIVLDKTIPTVSLSINPENPNGDNGWYYSIPEITLTAGDINLSQIEYQIDSVDGVWNVYVAPFKIDDGKHTCYYRSIDKAGNISNIGVKNVKVDTRSPRNVENVDAKYDEEKNELKLSWDSNDSDISKILVYRGGSRGFSVNSGSRVTENKDGDDSYTDKDVERGEKYYYKFVTRDDAGNKSDTKIISVKIPLTGGAAIVTNEGTAVTPQEVLGAQTGNDGTQSGQNPEVGKGENDQVAGDATVKDVSQPGNRNWPYWLAGILVLVMGAWWWRAKKGNNPPMGN